MRITHKDLKNGEIKIIVESITDLWYLSQIIDQKDIISGKTLRKIKIGNDSEDTRYVRKYVYMIIDVEKIEFTKDSNILRLTGTIKEGPDDVPLGSYHTISVEEGTEIKIKKNKWLSYQINKIKEACEEDKGNILLITLDRDEVWFALLKKYGYDIISSLKGDVEKKSFKENISSNFYKEIYNLIKEYEKRYNLSSIIVGSPAFWKEEFIKSIDDNIIKQKIHMVVCSMTGKKSFDELLKKEETIKILREQKISKEINDVENLFIEISKNGLASYGFEEVKKNSESGSIETLLITDSIIWKYRENNEFEKLDKIMKETENSKGIIRIISQEHEAGQKLNGLGGIAALLRFKLEY
jgi:protein pelota